MIKALAASLSLLLVAPAAAQAPTSAFRVAPVYTVKQQGGGLGVFVDGIAVFQRVTYRDQSLWVVERRRYEQRLGKKSFQHQWIDGRTCPAVDTVLAAAGKLPPVEFAAPGEPDGGWISDSAYITLMGPAREGRLGGRMAIRDLGGPVSRWWRESEAALASCWQELGVLVIDGSVPARLSTDEDAADAGRF